MQSESGYENSTYLDEKDSFRSKRPAILNIRKKCLTDSLFLFNFGCRILPERNDRNLTMIDLNTLHIDPAILDMIPKTSALELSVLPISQQNGVVIVAVPEMFPKQLLIDVRFLLGTKKVKPIPVSRENIVAAIHHFYATRPRPRSK